MPAASADQPTRELGTVLLSGGRKRTAGIQVTVVGKVRGTRPNVRKTSYHWENPLLEPRFRCFRQPMIYAKREVNYIGLYIVFQRTSILKNLSIELVPTTFFIGKRGCSLAFASGSSSIDTIGVIST